MNKREIIERLKNIARHAVHIVGEEPFVMSLDDGIAVNEAIELLEKSETDCSEIPNNSDIISRQMAIDALRTCYDTDTVTMDNGDEYINYDDAVGEIEQLPSIQSERKIGRWIPSDSELEIKCNKCGKDFSEYVDSIDYIYLAEYPKFCPNCGVKMEEGEQE